MSADLPSLQPLTPERADMLAADPAREHLLRQIATAESYDEIAAALQAQVAWLRANPDDFGVLQAGERLAYSFEALCLAVLDTLGYEPASSGSDLHADGLLRRRDGPPEQRIAVEIVWTYRPLGVDVVRRLVGMMKHARATDGLLISGTELTSEARTLALKRGLSVLGGADLHRVLRITLPRMQRPADSGTPGTGAGGSAPTRLTPSGSPISTPTAAHQG